MNTFKGRTLKVGGVALQLAGAFSMMLGSDTHQVGVMVVGGAISFVGLLLWGKGEAEKAVLESGVRPAAAIDASREVTVDVLETLQKDVARLQEDRDFYRDLYLNPGAAAAQQKSSRP